MSAEQGKAESESMAETYKGSLEKQFTEKIAEYKVRNDVSENN